MLVAFFRLRLAGRAWLFLTALSILACAPSYGQQPLKKNVYVTSRIATAPPDIDGKLDDAVWQGEGWFDDWTQQQPIEGAAPSERTAFKVVYDDRYIYAALRAFDSQPDKIARQVARRDVFAGDIMGIAFDSYFDRRTAYEFNMTAAGAKVDLIMTGTREFDTTWDAVWDGATAMEDSAWTMEIRVPLSQLRFSDKEEQVWGLHLWRWIHRLEEEVQFQLLPLDAVGTVYQFGELHGLRGLRPRRRIELMPYTTAKVSTFEPEDGNPFADGTRSLANVGLDAKVGLSNAFTLDLTINPDFGQVEADPSVMNLTAFETFYEEKRPFFLEGSNLFSFNFEGNDAFYSRRIGSTPHHSIRLGTDEYARMPETTTILGAAKLSGKTRHGLSIGILESLNAKESATMATPSGRRQVAVEPLTNYFVSRVEKEFNEGNTVVGGLMTAVNRRIDDQHLNYLNQGAYFAGLNFKHFWQNRTYFIDFMAVTSELRGSEEAMLRVQRSSTHLFQRPDADYLSLDSSRTHLWGHGASMEVGRGGNGRLRYSVDFSWNSPGLDLNDAGYQQIADRINLDFRTSYVVNDPTRFFRNYSADLILSRDWDWGWDVTENTARLQLRGQFHNFWRAAATMRRYQEALYIRKLRGGPGLLNPGSTLLHWDVQTDGRKPVDFTLSGYNQLGDHAGNVRHGIEPGMSWRVNNAITLSADLSYDFNRDDLQYIARTPYKNDRYVLGRISQRTVASVFRISYSLRPNLVIQFYGQPFISTGRYNHLKVVANPRASRYNDRFLTFTPDAVIPESGGTAFGLDEDGDGAADYRVRNPDFTFREFRSNLVLRWEYRPGSTFYLVWAQTRTGSDDASSAFYEGYRFNLGDELSRLYEIYPFNVFAIKLTHHLSTF